LEKLILKIKTRFKPQLFSILSLVKAIKEQTSLRKLENITTEGAKGYQTPES
jgi:hypothetical protein